MFGACEVAAPAGAIDVDDRNDGTAVILSDFHGHLAGFAAMFDGVVDEVGYGIEQKVSIAPDKNALIHDILITVGIYALLGREVTTAPQKSNRLNR